MFTGNTYTWTDVKMVEEHEKEKTSHVIEHVAIFPSSKSPTASVMLQ